MRNWLASATAATTPRSATATSRRGCCPTTAPAPTTGCVPTCAATPTATRWTWWWSGAGAGGGVLTQRLARAGWRVVCLDAGPVLGSRRRLGVRRARLAHPVLDRTAPDRRQRPGAARLEQLRPRRRRVDGALRRLHAALPPVGLRAPSAGTGSARTGRSTTPTCGRTTRRSSRSCRWPARTGRGATRTATRTRRTRSAATARSSCAVRGAAGIEARVGPVAIPNGRFGNRPHCIYRGFCLQGCKVNAKASPLITHIPDALAHGAEIRPDSMVSRVVVDDRTGAVTGVTYLRGRSRALPAGPGGGGRRLLHRDAAAAAALGQQALPGRAGQRPRPGRAGT